ncbi:MAG: VWA domain-containing protein [Candidatus Cloacimonetes bacterium]|nr:VWA domain-containing protein [Candidatus Cloacimonadota bacterium]MCF7813576.1 VWA domain-containing protein [Candidatus Cloacimonadota bacterium]MCF7868207.1 VWA domain-containing protein [Candidatus Cloacimonadota bacterium]MCF7883629.1 VWA domain-containing protein [Candidatus Cloacimonadota bacterium]
MRWGNPYLLFLLILIPIFFILIGLAEHRRKKNFTKFGESRFYNFFLQEYSAFHWGLKNVLFVIAILFMIIAIARPRWNKEVQIVKKEGIDIAICLDVSKSMDAQDIQPSRIDRAKDQISLFIDQLKGDRISIVAFAGRSYVQCPLTDDYGAAKLFLNLLDTESVPSYGTNIGGAIEKAISLFGEEEKHKVIIVVSDGEDLEESAIDVAKDAIKQNAIIYTLGVGSPEGSTIPLKDESGNTVYAKDDKGDIIFTKLDINTLTQIAKIGNGRFFPITPQQSEIFEIMKNINEIEKKKFDSREFVRYKEQYKYFVIAALILLILESLIIYKKKVKFKRVI